MDKFQVKILDIKEEYKYVWTYTLEKPDDLNWDEGSSFHLALPGYDETGEVNKKTNSSLKYKHTYKWGEY